MAKARAKPTPAQMKWGDPPRNACEKPKKPSKYQLMLQALSERPGEWAKLGQSTSKDSAENIRKRLNIAAHLCGCEIEATCQAVKRSYVAWARWASGPPLDFGGRLPRLAWEGPPKSPNKSPGEYKNSGYMNVARALAARPGEWARIRNSAPTYSSAYSAVRHINEAAARLGGRVETSVRCTADGYEAWAKYVDRQEFGR